MTEIPDRVLAGDELDSRLFDTLAAIRTDMGKRWGSIATEHQLADARAVLTLDPSQPRMHFLTRPRGGSKTTDLAAINLVALLTAPRRSVSHAFARDKDQAARLLDVLVAMAHRTGLTGLLEISNYVVKVKKSGAKLVVESADVGSAFGALPYFVTCDELAAWPTTRSGTQLWEAIVSGLPKRPDSRLVVITSAGDPSHWSHRVLEGARQSPNWRVSEMPGPVPWFNKDDLAEQQRLLTPSSFARLHLNQWTASEDRLVSPEDLRACISHSEPLDPQTPPPSSGYVVSLDLGLKNDATVITVCHAEHLDPETGAPRDPHSTLPTVVVDRIHTLRGTPANPVQIATVEEILLAAYREYNARELRIDPWQSIGLAQRLRTKGLTVKEFAFTSTSVGRIASNLYSLLRDHRMRLIDDPNLIDELQTVRLRETSPGVVRLDHDSGKHDDHAVSLGLAALALTERATGNARTTVPKGAFTRNMSADAIAKRPKAPIRPPKSIPKSMRSAIAARSTVLPARTPARQLSTFDRARSLARARARGRR